MSIVQGTYFQNGNCHYTNDRGKLLLFCHRIVDKCVLLSLVYHSKIHKEKMKGYINKKEAKVSSIFDV